MSDAEECNSPPVDAQAELSERDRAEVARAAERASEAAQTAADQPTAQPKAKPSAKPASRGLYTLW